MNGKNPRASAHSGSVIIVVLVILSLMAITIDQLIRSAIIGSVFTNTMVDRERAQALALGGVSLAIAQLTAGIEAEEKQDNEVAYVSDKEQDAGSFGTGREGAMKKFIYHLIAHLNRWQKFTLHEKTDGVDGQVCICISSEHGKLNLNEAFDFQKKEFKQEYAILLKTLFIPGKIAEGEFYTQLTEFFQKRGRKICDVSELMTIPTLSGLDVFYHPPHVAEGGMPSEPNRDIYLCDIFTTWTEDATVDPLVFSDALCAVLVGQEHRPRADDATRMQDAFKQVATAFTSDFCADLDKNWKVLQPMYGEKPKIYTALKELFAKKFSSKVYSVVSYGKVNNTEQRLLAIVREVEEKQKQDEKDEGAAPKKIKRAFKIVRLYWL